MIKPSQAFLFGVLMGSLIGANLVIWIGGALNMCAMH
jgi:hypothetical protein